MILSRLSGATGHGIRRAREAVTLAIAMWVDKRLDASYSDFWHRDQLRLRLRKALGLG